MTWEDARQIIATWLVSSKGAKGQCGYIEGWFDEEDAEAFRMAIEALQWQDRGHSAKRTRRKERVMTKEEAIQELKEDKMLYETGECHAGDGTPDGRLLEALNMAIGALNEADKREQYGQNYEADDFVKLGVTDKNKDKVILYDAFGEKEYYPQTDLVRCKDCRHIFYDKYNDCYMCDKHEYGESFEDNDFCSWGERREP